MYKGSRDAHINIKVPMDLCYLTEFASGLWVEVLVPPKDLTSDTIGPWESFMVKPEQVCWLDAYNNVVEGLNAHTAIRVIKHYNDDTGKRRIIPETEAFLDPYEIIQRIEMYVYAKNNK